MSIILNILYINKSIQYYSTKLQEYKWQSSAQKYVYNKYNKYPAFVNDLFKSDIFAQIDGITDLLGISDGFLIIFNINGNPKFCITNGDKLSDNVFLGNYFILELIIRKF